MLHVSVSISIKTINRELISRASLSY